MFSLIVYHMLFFNIFIGRQSKSYKRSEDYEKSDEPRVICKDLIKETNDFESKCKKGSKCDINEKELRKCTRKNNQKRSNSCRRRNSSRAGDKSCSKVDGKRCYSQSIFSIPQDRKSFSTLISDIVLDTNVSKTVQRFYASCSKDKEEDREQFCEERKKICRTKEKDEVKKKCVKSPVKCISRKKPAIKCQSTEKEKDKKSCESTKRSSREEFCINRKKEFMKGKLYLILLYVYV